MADDAPIYSNPRGYNGYLEMREMEKSGVPPGTILASATLENARFFKIEDRYGTIEAGKVASASSFCARILWFRRPRSTPSRR